MVAHSVSYNMCDCNPYIVCRFNILHVSSAVTHFVFGHLLLLKSFLISELFSSFNTIGNTKFTVEK